MFVIVFIDLYIRVLFIWFLEFVVCVSVFFKILYILLFVVLLWVFKIVNIFNNLICINGVGVLWYSYDFGNFWSMICLSMFMKFDDKFLCGLGLCVISLCKVYIVVDMMFGFLS